MNVISIFSIYNPLTSIHLSILTFFSKQYRVHQIVLCYNTVFYFSVLDWTVVYCTVLDWTVLDCSILYCTGLDWTGLDWTGLDWTGLDWTGLHRTVQSWSNSEEEEKLISWNEIHFSTVQYSAEHNSKIKYKMMRFRTCKPINTFDLHSIVYALQILINNTKSWSRHYIFSIRKIKSQENDSSSSCQLYSTFMPADYSCPRHEIPYFLLFAWFSQGCMLSMLIIAWNVYIS